MTKTYPSYVTRATVAERLPLIFPEGTPNRTYCIRELSASTVFTALYIGAVEGNDIYLGPVHVYRMTDEQEKKSDLSSRKSYVSDLNSRREISGKRWYADNTREPIRDETLRDGLVAIGAVTQRKDLPTTSGLPRYALIQDFANLFDPDLTGDDLEKAISKFQSTHLSKSAQVRISIMLAGAAASKSKILVNFPNGETRQLAPGKSSVISKAVIEEFTKLFLEEPVVIWLSESGNKVVLRDDQIANKIGLQIEVDKNLPDIILADLKPTDPLIIFVEVVATDGAITERRRDAIFDIIDKAGFKRSQIAFLTAYEDRESAGFKKTVAQLSWDSFVWFLSQPENIVLLRSGESSPIKLSQLIPTFNK